MTTIQTESQAKFIHISKLELTKNEFMSIIELFI